MQFKYVVRQFNRIRFHMGEKDSTPAIGIGVKYKDNNFVYPSPLTNYITSTSTRKSKAISTQKRIANETVWFLNYCIKNIEYNDDFSILKDKGLYGLDLSHGANYISYLTAKTRKGNLIPNGVYESEKFLIRFYEWLNEENIITIPELEDIEEGTSPFDDKELGTEYPSRGEHIPNKIVDFGDNRLLLTYKFIKIAEIVAPEIALGICFQFFGGVRRSEVVNLTKRSFKRPTYYDKTINRQQTLLLVIKNNQELLFPDKINHTHEQVKRPRQQCVMPFKIVSDVLRRHKNQLSLLEQRGKIKNRKALFVDYKTGETLSGLQYHRRFNKVKQAFLEQLAQEQHIDFDVLNEEKWSTHIGRGVFTNILLDRGADIVSTAIARGDKTIDTVIKYVDHRRALGYTQDAINQLSADLKKEKEQVKKSFENGIANITLEDIHWEGDF
ncbi:hypothetical protein [Mesobacillus sp.]|uniref:hypothetical protein n=2 Tax=Mesobacillus TaxID=2675231 RepID=UPI0039F12F1C